MYLGAFKLWIRFIYNYFAVAMLIWLEMTLFKLKKIVIFMDPENDTEQKIRSKLKRLKLMRICYGIFAILYNLKEFVFYYLAVKVD